MKVAFIHYRSCWYQATDLIAIRILSRRSRAYIQSILSRHYYLHRVDHAAIWTLINARSRSPSSRILTYAGSVSDCFLFPQLSVQVEGAIPLFLVIFALRADFALTSSIVLGTVWPVAYGLQTTRTVDGTTCEDGVVPIRLDPFRHHSCMHWLDNLDS